MVHPAALAISLGIALGGAIFALFYLNNNRNENNQWRYQEHEPRNFSDYYPRHLDSDICSICLDRFDENVVDLECLHRFHIRCIEESLRHSHLCPNCRQEAKIRRID